MPVMRWRFGPRDALQCLPKWQVRAHTRSQTRSPESGVETHHRSLAGAPWGKCDGAFQGRGGLSRILNEFRNWSAWGAVSPFRGIGGESTVNV